MTPDLEANAVPKLLVSVRSPHEALAALQGGAGVIDVKEPRRGSLGMADPDVIRDVATAVGATAPVSVALGETVEWFDRPPCRLPDDVAYVKVGLGQLAAHADWCRRWRDVRTEFDEVNKRALAWIAVAYVDAHAAESPLPEDVIAAAADSGCRGVLFDTFRKSSGRLLELSAPSDLTAYCDEIHAAGMMAALAGRLARGDISALADVPADIIAVRSAACRNADRTSDVDAALVHGLQLALERWFGRAEVHGDRRRQPGAPRDLVHRP